MHRASGGGGERERERERVYERVGAETDSLTITGSHTPLTIPRASLRCPGLGKLSPDTGLSNLPGRRRKSHLGGRGREREREREREPSYASRRALHRFIRRLSLRSRNCVCLCRGGGIISGMRIVMHSLLHPREFNRSADRFLAFRSIGRC